MKTPALRSAGIALLFVALTVAMTWPQATRLSTQVYDSDDPLLSIWRISWIAHILPESPVNLLNGNIFYPEKRTLAYTDSVLLEGLAGAPLIWAGVSPVTTYNLLLLLSIALSGWAMWRYALYLTGSNGASILAGSSSRSFPTASITCITWIQATIFCRRPSISSERSKRARAEVRR